MIHLDNVTDSPHLYGRHQDLLEGANLTLPKGRFALLSETPELHTALIDIMAGLRPPRYGVVQHDALVSWPIGRMGFVRGKLTGIQMTNFICNLYGLDRGTCLDFLNGIMTSPEYLRNRIMDWPNYVRQEYIFSISLVPTFELFIVDNMMPLPNSRFGRLWNTLFEERVAGRSLILAAYNDRQIMDYCTKALVYEHGTFRIDDDLESCLRRYPLKQFRSERPSDADGDDVQEFEESPEGEGDLFL